MAGELPVEGLAYKPITATGSIKRRLDERSVESFISVRDFGAMGINGVDYTDQIQRCFDAAFGPWSAPHGGVGLWNNKAVYFPPGAYQVSSKFSATVTAVANSPRWTNDTAGAPDPGAGHHWIRVTLNRITDPTSGYTLTNGDVVYLRERRQMGASHRGTNGAFEVSLTGLTGNQVDIVDTEFNPAECIAGGTIATPCLRVRGVYGGYIFGAGKYGVSLIASTSPNCITLCLNGWYKGRIENLHINGGTGGIAVDYNATATAVGSTASGGFNTSSQSSAFEHLEIGDSNSDYALTIGWGQNMCSETAILSCAITGRTGIIWLNYNALQGTIIGGNIAGCAEYGIHVVAGSCPVIQGVGIQNGTGGAGMGYISGTTLTITSISGGHFVPEQSLYSFGSSIYDDTHLIQPNSSITANVTGSGELGTYTIQPSQTVGSSGSPIQIASIGLADIFVENAGGDGYSIVGCRSESHNFLKGGPAVAWHIANCTHLGQLPGKFWSGNGSIHIESCYSDKGYISTQGASFIITNSIFFRSDYLTADPFGAHAPGFLDITPMPIRTVTGTAYTLVETDFGSKLQFTSSTAVTVTVPFPLKTLAGSAQLQQMTTGGKITLAPASGIVIHSSGSQLSTNGQWATMTLSCDSVNVFTLTGDKTT